MGRSKPWSEDPVFQSTYFCNVRREDDRVTRWIRNNWSPEIIGWENYEIAMVLARFLNWPGTLELLFDSVTEIPINFRRMEDELYVHSDTGHKVWGGAYVVTTHGIPMGKVAYLCQRVLPAAYELLGAGRWRGAYAGGPPTLAARHAQLMQLEGLGSFMAAQVIADLKNTKGHPLWEAPDWYTWSAHGPGSLRGLTWFHEHRVSPAQYTDKISQVNTYLEDDHPEAWNVYRGNMQDLQNCLCEYDKYMRVSTGSGRSKRGYQGT